MQKLPSLIIQKEIVSKLDMISEAVECEENKIQLYDELIKSKFVELFGDPVNNTMHWDTKKIKKLTSKIGSGSTPKGGRSSYIEEGISLIRSMNVYDDEFIYDKLAHISDAQAQKLDNVTIEENDVLLNITGASVTRCCVVPYDALPARVNQHVSIIRCLPDVNPKFLCRLLINEGYKQILWNIAENGATRQALTKTDIENFEIIVPPIELQNNYVEIVEESLKAKKHALEKVKFLTELQRTEMHKYFD